jgi:hypothetical protein
LVERERNMGGWCVSKRIPIFWHQDVMEQVPLASLDLMRGSEQRGIGALVVSYRTEGKRKLQVFLERRNRSGLLLCLQWRKRKNRAEVERGWWRQLGRSGEE